LASHGDSWILAYCLIAIEGGLEVLSQRLQRLLLKSSRLKCYRFLGGTVFCLQQAII